MASKTAALGEWKPYLYLPCELAAVKQAVVLCAGKTEQAHICARIAQTKVDGWLCLPLARMPEDCDGALTLHARDDCWLDACYLSGALAENTYGEDLRPQIHFSPLNGGVAAFGALRRGEKSGWQLSYSANFCDPEEADAQSGVPVAAESQDLLHWSTEHRLGAEDKTVSFAEATRANPPGAGRQARWMGDVSGEVCAADAAGGEHVLALGARTDITGLPASRVLSLPAVRASGRLAPAPAVDNLRVWNRLWRGVDLEREFFFDMRFRVGPAEWPGISILKKDGTADDITTQACEVNVELFVGMEPEVVFELAGAAWKWDALSQTMHCNGHALSLPPENGRLKLRFYADGPVQELFTSDGQAVMVLLPDGPGKIVHQIHNEEIENIQNPNFTLRYYPAPSLRIRTPGKTAQMIELSVFGLRPALPGPAERKLLDNVERGAVLYETEPYTVCENCVEDRVYGPPAAWALDGGKTVLSPVRAVEEFRWRSTPWGDMTRIVDRGAVWRAGDAGSYPVLSTGVPVLDAAYRLAVDVMRRNVNEAYALPGQKGLMNAALFQGKGEGFGIWKRDAAHAALRIQNLLAPADTRRSLIYITEHGFDNGSDAAAMLPIAVWDHYLATGDKTVLFEALPGVLRCVAQADSLFDESRGLVRAEYSAAQDAFPEPENAGFCLSPQVFYAHLYLDAARICEKINEQANARGIWKARGTAMLDIIRREYWNADKACFTSGPSGSDSYQNGWWEATGAEAVLWPRFGVASGAQRDAFLRTIEANRIALSDFGFNWYPFATGKNHFWHACWPSWSLGVAVAAARAGRADLLERLIFQQVRNVLLNKTFHEVIDNDTGRAWRWPGLPWHAAAFLGFIVYGVFGLSYDETGMRFSPCVPQAFANAKLSGLAYRGAKLEVALSGAGTRHVCTIGGNAAAPTVMPDGTGACQINFTATP